MLQIVLDPSLPTPSHRSSCHWVVDQLSRQCSGIGVSKESARDTQQTGFGTYRPMWSAMGTRFRKCCYVLTKPIPISSGSRGREGPARGRKDSETQTTSVVWFLLFPSRSFCLVAENQVLFFLLRYEPRKHFLFDMLFSRVCYWIQWIASTRGDLATSSNMYIAGKTQVLAIL